MGDGRSADCEPVRPRCERQRPQTEAGAAQRHGHRAVGRDGRRDAARGVDPHQRRGPAWRRARRATWPRTRCSRRGGAASGLGHPAQPGHRPRAGLAGRDRVRPASGTVKTGCSGIASELPSKLQRRRARRRAPGPTASRRVSKSKSSSRSVARSNGMSRMNVTRAGLSGRGEPVHVGRALAPLVPDRRAEVLLRVEQVETVAIAQLHAGARRWRATPPTGTSSSKVPVEHRPRDVAHVLQQPQRVLGARVAAVGARVAGRVLLGCELARSPRSPAPSRRPGSPAATPAARRRTSRGAGS